MQAITADRACSSHRFGTCCTAPGGVLAEDGQGRMMVDIKTDQNFLRIADAPGKVAHRAVSLHHFGCELNSEPVPHELRNMYGVGDAALTSDAPRTRLY